MGLRSAEEFLEKMNDGREVYYDGERVGDIPGHPVLGKSARHFARAFRLQADPRYVDLATVEEDGERSSRFFAPPRNGAELQELARLVEAFALEALGADFHMVKYTAANALLALQLVGKKIDREHGTDYAPRADTLMAAYRRDDRTAALCMSDTKGDRTKKPQDQTDPDLFTHIVERRPDGVVIRGAKTSVTGAPFVDEQIVMPTKNLGEAEADYAVACAVPTNSPGVKIIASHGIQPPTSTFDSPLGARYLALHPTVFFDDVFVPWERVLLAGESAYAIEAIMLNGAFLRLNATASGPPKADMLVGAAQTIAEMNGVERIPLIRDKLAELMIRAETLRAFGVAAIQQCEMVEGVAVPNNLIANVGKYHATSGFHRAIELIQDIAGGGLITSPSAADLQGEVTGPLVEKYFVGAREVSAEERLRMFNLIRDLTASDHAGDEAIATLHGGGSMSAQKQAVLRGYDIQHAKDLAQRAATREGG
jgi:4-hydroxybutyryl-CoA dehydratase/vinylacetyl-CoA-Delta-isomerase